MAQRHNPFRGGNVVHRIDLPRRPRPAKPAPAEPKRPASEPLQSPLSPYPAQHAPECAPDPGPAGPLDEGARPVVDVEFEVLTGSQVPVSQIARAQERQGELERALTREASAQENLKVAHRQEVEFLERRLTKLRGLLEAQEVDLRRAVTEGQIDSGWASCYRDVQGLDMSAPDADLKREMLTQIFQANRSLQARIAALGA